jgi:hypothetical protein
MKVNVINEFDKRQLGQMKALIGRLREGQIPLHQFVTDQWALVDMLEGIGTKWKERYFSLVNIIEDIYATMLDSGRASFDLNESKIVEDSLNKMLVLLSAVEPESEQ